MLTTWNFKKNPIWISKIHFKALLTIRRNHPRDDPDNGADQPEDPQHNLPTVRSSFKDDNYYSNEM